MPPGLAKKFAGLPRWAWVAILAGGLTIGLVMRSRQNAAADQAAVDTGAANADNTGYSPDIGCGPDGLDVNGNPCGDTYTPTGTDQLGTGGYVNYPIQPLQPGINVTVGGGPTPCDEKTKPKTKPHKGYQWACIQGNWREIPLRRHGGGHGQHHHNCPPHHEWRNGKCRKKHPGNRNGGSHQPNRHKVGVL